MASGKRQNTMNLNRHTLRTAAFALTLAVVPAACGSDDDSPSSSSSSSSSPSSSSVGSVDDGAATVPAPDAADALPTPDTASPLVVGKPEAEAQTAIEAAGWTMRVVQRDGEDLAVTADFVDSRVNVTVDAGIVISVANIG